MQRRSVLPALIGPFAPLAALWLSGCGFLTKTIDVTADFPFAINSTDPSYDAVIRYDPNENKDVRENHDKIKSGQILSIQLLIQGVGPQNLAQFVRGRV